MYVCLRPCSLQQNRYFLAPTEGEYRALYRLLGRKGGLCLRVQAHAPREAFAQLVSP